MGPQIKLPPPPPLADLAAQHDLALFLDFDGTLVAIASGPDAIEVAAGLSASLEGLSRRFAGRLALVSGRSLEDLCRHLGAPAIFRAGSHGAALCRPDGTMLGKAPKAIPAAVMRSLEEFAVREGLHFEPKTHGAAIHYRARPDLAGQAEAFAEQQANAHGLEVKNGKAVVELVWPGGGKEGAVRLFMVDPVFAGAMPIFIGDDVTDEDGFIAATELGGFGIAVGERISNNARYHLETVQDVHKWLKF